MFLNWLKYRELQGEEQTLRILGIKEIYYTICEKVITVYKCVKMFLKTLEIGEWSVRNWAMGSIDGMHESSEKRKMPIRRNSSYQQVRERVSKKILDGLAEITIPLLSGQYIERVSGARVSINV